MESKLKGNMNGVLTQWHGQKFMNLIWFILVLRAHDLYSSSNITLEIIMPQKKNFEMQENYKSLTMLNDLCQKGCLCFSNN